MSKPHIRKILVGQVKQVGHSDAINQFDRKWETGMFKQEVHEKIWLGKNRLTCDEVADTINHGGPEKAIFAYPTVHYEFWKQELGVGAIGIGDMGENLAVDDMDEHSACIGDTYQFGDAVIQISQPRQPCWKPARRLRRIDFALHIQNSGKTGWYFRVLKEGYVEYGLELSLLERPYPQWTIAKCNEVMHVEKNELRLSEELAACVFLADGWKQTLKKRIAGENSSINKRIYGPNKE